MLSFVDYSLKKDIIQTLLKWVIPIVCDSNSEKLVFLVLDRFICVFRISNGKEMHDTYKGYSHGKDSSKFNESKFECIIGKKGKW